MSELIVKYTTDSVLLERLTLRGPLQQRDAVEAQAQQAGYRVLGGTDVLGPSMAECRFEVVVEREVRR